MMMDDDDDNDDDGMMMMMMLMMMKRMMMTMVTMLLIYSLKVVGAQRGSVLNFVLFSIVLLQNADAARRTQIKSADHRSACVV